MTSALRWKVPVLRMLHECSLRSAGVFSAANFYLRKFHSQFNPIIKYSEVRHDHER